MLLGHRSSMPIVQHKQQRRSSGGSGGNGSALQATQGTNQGSTTPNLFYRSMHHDALRTLDNYIALPEQIVLSDAQSLRYVRQGSETWRAAHHGRITTGSLLALLGWRHEKGASRLGLSRGMRGNEHLPDAYNALLAGPDAALAAALAAGGDGSGGFGGINGAADAEVANEAARVAYNVALRGAEPPSTCAATRREISERAAAAGELSVRLAFGKVQEHAALYSLLRLYPSSVLEEAGLFVPPAEQLQLLQLCDGGDGGDGGGLAPVSPVEHAGSSSASGAAAAAEAAAPPVGASPDAIICHELRFSWDEVAHARGLLAAGRRREAALGLLRAGLARVPCLAPPAGSDGDGVVAAAQPPAAARAQPAESPCGALGGPTTEERLLAFIEVAAAGSSGISSISGGGFGQQQQQQQQQGQGGTGLYPKTLWVREVVEVKTHCPFACRARARGRKGRVALDYAVRASCAPFARAEPSWVPQLQLHMLCTGCLSALLVSRAPHAGVRAFRVYRDDEFLAAVLSILAGLSADVAAGKPAPRATAHLDRPVQAAALARARAVAYGAEVAAELELGSGSSGGGSGSDGGDDGAAAAAAAAEVLLPPPAHDASNVAAFWT